MYRRPWMSVRALLTAMGLWLVAFWSMMTMIAVPIALAAEDSVAVADWRPLFVNAVLAIGGTLLLPLLGLALQSLFHKMAADRSAAIKAIIERVDDFIMTLVTAAYQAAVKPAKEAGTWNAQVAAETKANVVTELKSWLGSKGLAELMKLVTCSGALESFLEKRVELAVNNRKLVGASAKAGVIDPLPASAAD